MVLVDYVIFGSQVKLNPTLEKAPWKCFDVTYKSYELALMNERIVIKEVKKTCKNSNPNPNQPAMGRNYNFGLELTGSYF